jgi:hypothetical protein
MTRLTLIITGILIYGVCSCEKDDAQQPDKPTADFREQFKGVFSITHKNVKTTNPPIGQESYWDTLMHYEATVDFAATDSVVLLMWNTKMPALTFSYSYGGQETFAVDTAGRLYRNPGQIFPNYMGFIGPDSIYHAYHEGHISTAIKDTIWGSRIP